VFITDSEPGSPFMEVTSQSNKRNAGNLFQITRIGDRKVSSLDDVAAAAQEVCNKRVYSVRYISIGGDTQESSAIVKQVPEFTDAKFYTFNSEIRKWEVSQINK
jgi:hypothetical protein